MQTHCTREIAGQHVIVSGVTDVTESRMMVFSPFDDHQMRKVLL